MVEFKKSVFTATTVSPNERTLASITRPNLTLHSRRHVTASVVRSRSIARPLHVRQLPALEILEQQRQRAIEYDSWISVWDQMSEQILNSPELRMCLATNRELHFVTLRRQRSNQRRRNALHGRCERRFCLEAYRCSGAVRRSVHHRRLSRHRAEARKFANSTRHIRLWPERGNLLLHLALALMPRCIEKTLMSAGREMTRKE